MISIPVSGVAKNHSGMIRKDPAGVRSFDGVSPPDNTQPPITWGNLRKLGAIPPDGGC